MKQHYEEEFKKKIVRLHIEDGRTLNSLSGEYGVSKASISIWMKTYRKECQSSHETAEEYDYLMENRKFQKQLEEIQKENLEYYNKSAVANRRKVI